MRDDIRRFVEMGKDFGTNPVPHNLGKTLPAPYDYDGMVSLIKTLKPRLHAIRTRQGVLVFGDNLTSVVHIFGDDMSEEDGEWAAFHLTLEGSEWGGQAGQAGHDTLKNVGDLKELLRLL